MDMHFILMGHKSSQTVAGWCGNDNSYTSRRDKIVTPPDAALEAQYLLTE
jgi:hypothetical protein